MRIRGFTLIEILVVIAILAIVVSVVTLHATPNPATLARLEGERLALLFGLAQEEAQLRGRNLAWEANAQGYQFIEQQGARWQTLADSQPLRPRAWPLPVALRLWQDGEEVVRIEFFARGLNPPFAIELTQAGQIGTLNGDGMSLPRWQPIGRISSRQAAL